MKSCQKWIIICLLGMIAVVFVLSKLGLPTASATILIPLLMFGCCVIPMLAMMFRSGKLGGCCSYKHNSETLSPDVTGVKTTTEKPSCH